MYFILLCCCASALQIFQMSQADVDTYLTTLRTQQPVFGARVIDVATRSLGTPYFDGPLGEGPGAKYDPDPLMDLTRVDCVTFIEQTIALAASSTYKEAFDLLQKIRYKNGEIAFERRNHFMEADWIPNNAFCHSVTQDLKVPTAKVTRTIGRKKFFDLKKAPELAATATDQTMELAYVPSSEAANAERNLPSPALILFIGKADWLFVVHCGLFVRADAASDDSGKGLLYHASSTEGKVVNTALAAPFDNSTRYLGFIAYAIDDPAAGKKP